MIIFFYGYKYKDRHGTGDFFGECRSIHFCFVKTEDHSTTRTCAFFLSIYRTEQWGSLEEHKIFYPTLSS